MNVCKESETSKVVLFCSPMQYPEINGMREYPKVPNYYGDVYRQIPPARENWDGIIYKIMNVVIFKQICFPDDSSYLRNGGYPRILPDNTNIDHQPSAPGIKLKFIASLLIFKSSNSLF